MNTIRRLFSVLLVTMVFMSVATTANAVSPAQTNVQPRYVGVSNSTATLSISSSGRATVNARVYTFPDYTANLVVSLECDSGTPVKSWNNSGGGSVTVDKIYYVSTGHNYYVSASIEVFDKNGKSVDSFTTESSVVAY